MHAPASLTLRGYAGADCCGPDRPFRWHCLCRRMGDLLAEMDGKGITPVPTDPAALGARASAPAAAAVPLAAAAAGASGEPGAATAVAAAPETGPAAEAGEDARLASAEAREKGNACFKKKQWEQVCKPHAILTRCVPVATDGRACRLPQHWWLPDCACGLLARPSVPAPACRAGTASLPAGGRPGPCLQAGTLQPGGSAAAAQALGGRGGRRLSGTLCPFSDQARLPRMLRL